MYVCISVNLCALRDQKIAWEFPDSGAACSCNPLCGCWELLYFWIGCGFWFGEFFEPGSFYNPDWPWPHRDSSTSVLPVLGLKVCLATPKRVGRY